MHAIRFFPALLLGMLLIPGSGLVTPAEALLASHDCSFCHDFHGAPSSSGLLKYSSSEVLCLTCHATINGSTDAAAVHNPLGLASNQQGYITCRECHNPHDNIGTNIKLVGFKYDPEYNLSFSLPKIRVELPGSDPVNPVHKTVTFTSMTDPADYYRHDGKGACEICHSSNHLIGKDCTVCHLHNNDFGGTVTPPQGFPISPPGSTCTRCHTGTGTDASGFYSFAAYNVGPSGTHMKIKATDPANAACTACHRGHSDAPIVVIPNNTTVGINYAANGETGISLGGTATTGTTEAEICWNCHDQNNDGDLADAGDISEWKGFAYNGYTVTGSKSWATANFDAPGTRIPNRATVSIHTANEVDADAAITKVRASSVAYNVDGSGRTSNHANFSGTKTLEDVKYIRCSYCHDVHNTYGPNKGATWTFDGVSRVNAPTYLRGKWFENPYKANTGTVTAEIPPQTTNPDTGAAIADNYFTGNQWAFTAGGSIVFNVTVPRLIANASGSRKAGGFFIDQNSGWPTRAAASATYMPVAETAGLCTMCHDVPVDSMDYYTGSSLWRTDLPNWKNGHANSTLGGSGRNSGNDIFDARRTGISGGTTVLWYMGGQGADTVNTSQWGQTAAGTPKPQNNFPFGRYKYGVPSNEGKPDNDNLGVPIMNTGWYNWAKAGAGRISNSTNLRGGDYANWYASGVVGGDGRDNVRAHNFTCSKCHTPHASGLPALLITNCLDYGVANWSKTGNSQFALSPMSANGLVLTAMNNCHRKSSTSTGWHKLAAQQ